ncbi:MAG: hypothetical protein HY928_01895 [Elusimicrobia bacterium]|nr:hypothetical protein [Elusimicrobiota bacterium]
MSGFKPCLLVAVCAGLFAAMAVVSRAQTGVGVGSEDEEPTLSEETDAEETRGTEDADGSAATRGTTSSSEEKKSKTKEDKGKEEKDKGGEEESGGGGCCG